MADGRFCCQVCGARTSVTAGTIFYGPAPRWPCGSTLAGCSPRARTVSRLRACSGRWRLVRTRPRGDVAPATHGPGPPRPLRSHRNRADRRDVRGRRRTRATRRPGPGKKVAHRHRGRGPPAARVRPVPDCARGRWVGPIPARLRYRPRRARSPCRHGPAGLGYHGLDRLGYRQERRAQRAARAHGEDPHELLPAVHRVASLAKLWALALDHQGSVDEAHLPAYLNEFSFRFNRRRSHSRGLLFYRVLELAVDHDPVRYRELVAQPQSKATPPRPPVRRRSTAKRATPPSEPAMA